MTLPLQGTERMRLKNAHILCAILSGLLLSASFPPGRMPWMAWIALVPLLKSVSGQSGSRAFLLGLLAGLSHYFTLVYWIMVVIGHYGGLDPITSLGILILFSLYLSLYPACFAYVARIALQSRFPVFWSGALWVSLEYARAVFLTGFPWCLLGHSQYPYLPLIQIVSLTGVYGVSFLLVGSNALLYRLLFERTAFRRWTAMAEGAMVLLLIAGFLMYGEHRLRIHKERGAAPSSFRVSVIQGNIDQSLKWNPEYQDKTVRIYEGLSDRSALFKPDLLVWPETAVPFFFQEDIPLSRRVRGVAAKLDTPLIFGSPAYARESAGPRFYNRAYLLSSRGAVAGYYDKIHLVPFGEYVPLKRFLPFVKRLVAAAGDFAAGEKLAPLPVSGFPAGILICYEVIFAELARAQVNQGARILVNLTNDAWFGMTSAPHQHLAMAVFRAVENGIPLVRAANTGISAFISPTGEMVLYGGLFRQEVLNHELRHGEPTAGFYTRHGDLFAVALLLFSLIKIICALWYNGLLSSSRRAKDRKGSGGFR